MRTVRDERRRNSYVLLLCYHLFDYRFVINSFLTARRTALKQTVVALCVKQALFIKAGTLKLMIDISSQHKIILVINKRKQIFIHFPDGTIIAVY